VIQLDIIDVLLKNFKSTNDILSDETCFVLHSECEGHVMRRLKDVWLKYTCILKGCMIAMKLVGRNIYLRIMWCHLNFLDDNVVVHNIYGSSHQTESAQLAWS